MSNSQFFYSNHPTPTQATLSPTVPDATLATVASRNTSNVSSSSFGSNSSSSDNSTSSSGSNQMAKPEAGSNNHILLALLTVSILVIAIFAIVTTWRYLKKKKNKKNTVIQTSTGRNKIFEDERPLRHFGDSIAMVQSPIHRTISNPPGPPQVIGGTMERFVLKIENSKPTEYSPQQLVTITKDFTTKLGSGGFGDVYKGELDDGVLVAVKRLKDNKSAKRIQEQLMAEVGTIGTTYHKNLVSLHGYCIKPTMTAIVYEYMENGSLDRFLFGGNKVNIEWQKLHEIAIGTAKGIAYLHEDCKTRIIHYDIKPANILLDAKLIPKVADFGLAKICRIGDSHVTLAGGRGTPGYAAPELWNPLMSPVTYKCDVYSFGIVLFEIVGRRRCYDTEVSQTRESLPSLPSRTWEMLKKKRLLELVSRWGIEEKDRAKAERMLMVALCCIQHYPERRPVMSDVLKMLEGKDVITPSYPFEYDPVESASGRKDCSNPSRLRKSNTLIYRSITPADSFSINL